MAKIIKAVEPASNEIPPFEPGALESSGLALRATNLSPSEREAIIQDIMEEGRAEAEEKVRAAYEEGLRRGLEAGEEQFRQQIAECAEALANVAVAIRQSHEEFVDSLEPQVVEIMRAIAQKILHREAETDPGLIGKVVRAALEKLAEREHVIVRLNPSDLEAMREQKVTLLEEFDGVERLDLMADETITPGGCIVETDLLHVDARIEEQVQAFFDAMTE